MKDFYIEAGNALKNCRANSGMTVRKLSAKSGVSTNSITNIEKGRYNPRFVTFIALLDAMGYEFVIRKKKEK